MKKIGILTFHNAYNYGAVLQAYATQELLRKMGYNPEIIDYHNAEIDRSYEVLRFHISQIPRRRPYLALKYLLASLMNVLRRRSFQRFSKRFFFLSRRYDQGTSFSIDGYDAVLVGSDQLWNPKLTGGFDKMYWGDIPSKSPIRKIAWSVCMNKKGLSPSEEEYIRKKINNFHRVSVREDSLKSLLQPLSKGSIMHTLDPTLLLARDKWEALCRPVKEKSYMVVYAVILREETKHAAIKLAEKTGKDLVFLHAYSDSNIRKGHKQFAGPVEFLSYIYGADLVVTSSFHGAAFSIIFGKPFFCIEQEDKENIRVRALLRMLNIPMSTLVSDGVSILECGKYKGTLEKDSNVAASIAFLWDALQDGRS